jgi:hypothetical protein
MINRVILSSILVLLLTACGKSADDQSIDLRFMAAEQTGAWYSLAVGITQEMKKQMPGLGNISILPW